MCKKMSNKFLFFLLLFIFSLTLFVLSIISICLAPIINNVIKGASNWRAHSCKIYKDFYDYYKNDKTYAFNSEKEKEKYLNDMRKGRNYCNLKKGMYSLEYLSFIINIIFYSILSFISLMTLFEVEKKIPEKIKGLIGIISGIVGFIVTLLYIIFSQYILSNGSPGKEYENPSDPNTFRVYNSDKIYKLDEERALAEWDSDNWIYNCSYYNEENKYDEDSLYIKYKDLRKSQYNYDKEVYLHSLILNSKISACNCITKNIIPEDECKYHHINHKSKAPKYSDSLVCPKLFYNNNNNNIETKNKYIYDRWIATLVFSYFIDILNIFEMVIGYLIFIKSNTPNEQDSLRVINYN